ncbi:DNA replication/repair protein RecF [Sulfoacidibacillus thermotolerans]|uniref:DNA replication and repair protein RecF n=1 Tax=Sulfoacidibacillus thermotolerans TaxID=1765684 RepID=A0A2U3D6A0_SULT2|nr:DNA replication/repair protein RecF [Sulfoacidibacillus thermotolerans]PWI56805.1 hypothetical protein BM613_11660 [Sulfoacidibacillus thermotolerans]
MKIERLDLQNFRTYSYTSLQFGPTLNVLLGQNAEGKTTILEAISMFAYGRSTRAKHEKELIQFGETQSQLRILFHRNGKQMDMAMKILEKGKQIKVNGVSKKNLSEFLGQLHIVFFTPDDLQMIKLGPDERRKFLNLNMGQFISGFVHHLRTYNQLLLQRNSLLRMRQFDPLPVWDEQLSTVGGVILSQRDQFIQELSFHATRIYKELSNQKETLSISYKTGVKGSNEISYRENLFEQLRQSAHHDVEKGFTTVGPHRDDLLFYLDGKPVSRFASQGQVRTVVLSLKFALFEYIREKTKELPIVLLDDVFSELDLSRQKHLLENLHGAQTILTTTDLENRLKANLNGKVFKIAHGIITVER